LTLPFDDAAWKDDAEESPPADLSVPEPDETFTLGTEESPDELRMPAAALEPDTTADPPVKRPIRRHPAPPDDDELDFQEEDDREPPERDARSERSSVGAVLIFLAVVVAGYGVLARALFASPALCDRMVSRVPLIGRLGSEQLLTRKVALSEVAGTYQRIKDGKDVFVISGKALNTAPVALHSIQIAGKLLDNTGQELDQKTIYCGNVISAKVLKDLTPRELSILQKLSPPKKFTVEPGESSTFVIVFMDPPRGAVEFSINVVAAQDQA
jgi:hypothetical protein